MRIVLVVSVLALTWGASIASAGGINLAWNDCYGAGGATNRSFACDTNTGANDLYLSIDPPVTVPDVVAYNATIDLQSASTTMPAWWQFKNVGSCRVGSLIPLSTPPPRGANNFVTWQGGAVGGAGCPAATPALNRTWGQLKSIYR